MKKANVAIFVPNLGCPHACSFCDQREIAGQVTIPTPHDVANTARLALSQLGDSAGNAEIAFFGGSFTAVEPTLMLSLLEAAAPFTGKGGFLGIRISTRPDAIDANILTTLKRNGVTAIELGAQSMDARVLSMNRRGHTPRDVESASALIHAYGFELGLQMMTGLYGSSPETDEATAHTIAALCPNTVRIYPTVVLKGTQLARFYREGLYKPPELDESVRLCAGLLEFFHKEDIKVIRLGLHATASIEKSYVAGPWHPAFRELCEGVIYRKKAWRALEGLRGDCREAVLFVNPREISKLAGQHRQNLLEFEDAFHKKIRVRGRDMDKYVVEAENGK
jgi:histone acetyltransferase (RNA polymerase elongator complex component)